MINRISIVAQVNFFFSPSGVWCEEIASIVVRLGFFLERKKDKKTDVKMVGFFPFSLSLYRNIGIFFFFKKKKMLSGLKRSANILKFLRFFFFLLTGFFFVNIKNYSQTVLIFWKQYNVSLFKLTHVWILSRDFFTSLILGNHFLSASAIIYTSV